jgi:hypothetical protein
MGPRCAAIHVRRDVSPREQELALAAGTRRSRFNAANRQRGGPPDFPTRGSSPPASALQSACYWPAASPLATRFSPIQSTNQGLIVPLTNKPVEFPRKNGGAARI